jgi:hypothetical protein
MGLFGKKEEPRSWAGETASDQYERSGDGPGGSKGSEKCYGSAHTRPTFVGHRWEETTGRHAKRVRYKQYTCLSCGLDWEVQG